MFEKMFMKFFPPKYLWCLLLPVLFISCDEAADFPKKELPSGCSFVSIEYTVLKTFPLRVRSVQRIWNNGLDQESIPESKISDQVPFLSFLDGYTVDPDEKGLIELIEIPLPKLDAEGNVDGLSDLTIPLVFRKSIVKLVDIDCFITVPIPPLSTYILTSYNIGKTVSTTFVCTIENADTKERSVINGEWRGNVYFAQEISIADSQNELVEKQEYPVIY